MNTLTAKAIQVGGYSLLRHWERVQPRRTRLPPLHWQARVKLCVCVCVCVFPVLPVSAGLRSTTLKYSYRASKIPRRTPTNLTNVSKHCVVTLKIAPERRKNAHRNGLRCVAGERCTGEPCVHVCVCVCESKCVYEVCWALGPQ